MAKILVVDDEPTICEVLSDILIDEGYQVKTASSGEIACEVAPLYQPNVILLDVWLGGIDGITTLKKLKQLLPNVGVIMMSGHGTINTAVKATRDGAYDFIEKPFDTDTVLLAITNFLALTKSQNKINESMRNSCPPIIGKSEKIMQLSKTITRLAMSNGRILIQGENGTGKELIARQIHSQSKRDKQPFVAINCAAIPEELIESELFGHEKGAFTGAHQQKIGKFEYANNGTLFLDEVGDMSLNMQAKLLRVLEEKAITRVGSHQIIPIDVRVISASNKELNDLVAQGNFRQDLLYRLNIIPIEIPPLRERVEDIPLLVNYFLKIICDEESIPLKEITNEAINTLISAKWPGNVRQLKNVVERVAIMSTANKITSDDIPIDILQKSSNIENYYSYEDDLRKAREHFEKKFIEEKLASCDSNITKAAEIMGIDRVHLHKKIKQYGIR